MSIKRRILAFDVAHYFYLRRLVKLIKFLKSKADPNVLTEFVRPSLDSTSKKKKKKKKKRKRTFIIVCCWRKIDVWTRKRIGKCVYLFKGLKHSISFFLSFLLSFFLCLFITYIYILFVFVWFSERGNHQNFPILHTRCKLAIIKKNKGDLPIFIKVYDNHSYLKLVGWVLWHINPCRSFNARSCLYIYIILNIWDL